MTITNVKEFDILPSRWDYFERRMDKLQEAAGRKVPPIEFKWTRQATTTKPLDSILIPSAMRGNVPDSRQLPNGDWVRDIIPVKIEYGDLINTKFDYVGIVTYGEVKDTAQNLKKNVFVTIAKDAAMSDEEHFQKVERMTPQLEALGEQWTSTKSVKCELCNPEGDGISRHAAYIVQAKEDVRQNTQKSLKGIQPPLNLKKGDIVQLGSACLKDFMGLDVKKIAAFYELDRVVGSYGPNGSPSNPAGWGYKEMGIYDYAERLVMFYGQREREWLNSVGKPFYKLPNKSIYNKGQMSKLHDQKIKEGDGCFIGQAGMRLLKSRVFNLYEDDPNQTPQWMLQPYTGQGGVKSFGWDAQKGIWLDGLHDDYDFIEVMEVNEADGTPIIDENTGDIKMIEVKVPSLNYIRDKLRDTWTGYGRYGRKKKRGEFALKILPIMPPAVDSEYVKNQRDEMVKWLLGIDITNLPDEFKGEADKVQRLKAMAELGYVGEKTAPDAHFWWKFFSIANFKKRQRKEYIKALKEYKDRMTPLLPAGGKWHRIKDKNDSDMFSYLREIYTNYGDRNRASSNDFDIVWMTQAQMDAFPAYKAQKEADRKKQEEERRKYNEYQSKVNKIRSDRYYNRGMMRNIPYEPSLQDFLKFMGQEWEALAQDMDRFSTQATNVVRVFPHALDTVRQAYLTQDEFDKVTNHFRPQLVSQPVSVPTPAPVTIAPTTPTVATKKPAMSKAAAYKLLQSNRPTSYAHSIGTVLPSIDGYCAMVSRPFRRRGMTGYGRTVTIVNTTTDEVYVFFYFGSKIPEQGKYYTVYDVEVEDHNEYKGLKQMIMEDTDGGQVQFIDSSQ